MSYTPEQTEALGRVGAAIQAEPELAPQGEEGWMLSEWVLVSCWVDPETGCGHLVRMAPPHMLGHHRTGLLREALDEASWQKEGSE